MQFSSSCVVSNNPRSRRQIPITLLNLLQQRSILSAAGEDKTQPLRWNSLDAEALKVLQETAAMAPQNGTPQDKDDALRQAASNGNVLQVQLLIADGANVNAADAEGWTSLHWAASGQAAVAKVLLDAGAVVDAADRAGKTTLHWAAAEGHTEVARVLLAAGAAVNQRDNDGWTSLQWAHEHAGVAQLLLEAGALVDAEDKFGKTCLHWSSQDGKTAVMQVLLKHGAAVNRPDHDGMTPLHWSSSTGQAAAVQLLLSAGAGPSIDLCDSQGITPLTWAALYGHERIVELLLEASGAAISKANLTAAAKAAGSHGHMQVFSALVVQLAQQHPTAVPTVLAGPNAPSAAAAFTALVGRCLADRQQLEQQQAVLAQQQAALQREGQELAAERTGIQHLIVSAAGVVKRAAELGSKQSS